ncbi:MAG: GDSL-type esterase/lipase family protein [Coriobacteriia bacterium]|nr:GDSL-type esterase/lipase family protein [Coriobacteriia bacterium]
MTAVRIACVGDSITRGFFVARRRTMSYPAQLQRMLGEGYCVRGFGVNGHAVQQSADLPYRRSKEFALSTSFEPDIVLIMLGTNDSRGHNWKGVAAFAADYRTLCEHYLSLESGPRVWLLTPPALFRPAWSTSVPYGMDPAALQDICGAIADLARELGCGLIDINAVTAKHPEAFRLDGVHPGAAGATIIATAVAEALRR